MRWRCWLLVLGILAIQACSPLNQEKSVESWNLTPFTAIPAEWGNLVAVHQYPGSKDVGWYELWFSDPESGRVTYVPLYRPEWAYREDRVRIIERTP